MNTAFYSGGWISSNGTGSGYGARSSFRTVLVYAYAMVVGTGGLMSAEYIAKRAERGYAYSQITNAPAHLGVVQRTPAENVARVREVLKPAVSDLAVLFGVSRQTIYDWQGGAQPSEENASRLSDLAGAADVLAMGGVAATPRLMQRRIAGGKRLLDIVREGGSVIDAAHTLAKMIQREHEERQTLDSKLAARTRQPVDYSDAGAPMLDETA